MSHEHAEKCPWCGSPDLHSYGYPIAKNTDGLKVYVEGFTCLKCGLNRETRTTYFQPTEEP